MAHVLVIEDDEGARLLVRTHLSRAGHEVTEAGSGSAALEQIRSTSPPDVVVLDVGLPDVNGFDLLSEIRHEIGDSTFPAIFLSGNADEKDTRRGESLGAVYLSKPYGASDLLDAVERATTRGEDRR